MSVAERIFKVLSEKGLTAKQLSDLTGISTGNISGWKKGHVNPSSTAVTKVAKALNVSPGLLFGEENDSNADNDSVKMPIYTEKASAGKGNALYGNDDIEYRFFCASDIPKRATHGIEISGDSMEPKIHDGDVAWIEKNAYVDDGQIGLFVLNGDSYCKKVKIDYENGNTYLTSLNLKYKPIKLNESDDLRTIGRVLI